MAGEIEVFRERDAIGADEIRGSFARLEPSDRNLLRQLTVRGADLGQPTHILAFLYFPTDVAARAAATALEGPFQSARIDDPGSDGAAWAVIAETRACLFPPNVQAMSAFCSDVAAKNGGEYDGWEAAIVKTNASMWFARWALVRRLFARVGRKSPSPVTDETAYYSRDSRR